MAPQHKRGMAIRKIPFCYWRPKLYPVNEYDLTRRSTSSPVVRFADYFSKNRSFPNCLT